MNIYLAVLIAVLAAGCSDKNVDAVDAPRATGAEPTAAGMDMADAEHGSMSEAQRMGMSERQPAQMSRGNSSVADASVGTSATATGTVDRIDAAAGKITISHGPVKALDWPAMTMGFKATPEQVASVRAGQKVSFEFTSQGMDATITGIQSQ